MGAWSAGKRVPRGGVVNVALDEGDTRAALVSLVVALVEIVVELLEHQAIRRMESGRLPEADVERLGLALQSRHVALAQLKADQGVDGAVRTLRARLDRGVADLVLAVGA